MKQFYQKYRPITLDDVIGQEKTVQNLKKRFKERNFPQSTIFIGLSGLGKTTLQRILAMSIVCKSPDKETGYPCLECSHCLDIMEERFILSVHEHNGSNLGVDDIRKMEEQASVIDFSGAPQVFIIDEYQEMENKAQKNLLKMIENDNPNAYFIIGTMDKAKVPDATKNRSQSFIMKSVDPNVLAEWMISILDKEGIKYPASFYDVDNGALFVIADSCSGSPRTALSLLEQAVYSELWNKKQIMEEMDLISSDSVTDICKAIIQGDYNFVFSNKWTADLVYGVRARFVDVFKYLNGVEFKNPYFARPVAEISSITNKEIVENILSVFFEMSKVFNNYWNQNFIEFFILKSMNSVKKSESNAPSIIRQRIPLKG